MLKKEIELIEKNYNLNDRLKLIDFINFNPLGLDYNVLSMLSEKNNNKQTETAAYYTDRFLLELIKIDLPNIKKDVIRILEPSVGVGNFLPIIIDYYAKKHSEIIIDVIDIDTVSIQLLKELLNKLNIPPNITINIINSDFLSINFKERYDLIIGNPPFLKINNQTKSKYKMFKDDKISKNLSALFLLKSVEIADKVVMIMPKYMLSNADFKIVREKVENYNIINLIDFGEKGFKGVLIETICIFIDTKKNNSEKNYTKVKNVTKNFEMVQEQSYITDPIFPNWILYRNDFFDSVLLNLELDQFIVFRDRQITNKILSDNGDIRVLKSRNIARDGSEIIDIKMYDSYVSMKDIKKLAVYKFLERDDVYLSPNMTYYPRVIRKPKNVLVNGSVAILILKEDKPISNYQLQFLSSKMFQEFYSIARNLSTRSLNLDNNSIFYFGLKKDI